MSTPNIRPEFLRYTRTRTGFSEETVARNTFTFDAPRDSGDSLELGVHATEVGIHNLYANDRFHALKSLQQQPDHRPEALRRASQDWQKASHVSPDRATAVSPRTFEAANRLAGMVSFALGHSVHFGQVVAREGRMFSVQLHGPSNSPDQLMGLCDGTLHVDPQSGTAFFQHYFSYDQSFKAPESFPPTSASLVGGWPVFGAGASLDRPS